MFYFSFLQAFYFDIIIDSQEIIKMDRGEPYGYPPLSLPQCLCHPELQHHVRTSRLTFVHVCLFLSFATSRCMHASTIAIEIQNLSDLPNLLVYSHPSASSLTPGN